MWLLSILEFKEVIQGSPSKRLRTSAGEDDTSEMTALTLILKLGMATCLCLASRPLMSLLLLMSCRSHAHSVDFFEILCWGPSNICPAHVRSICGLSPVILMLLICCALTQVAFDGCFLVLSLTYPAVSQPASVFFMDMRWVRRDILISWREQQLV